MKILGRFIAAVGAHGRGCLSLDSQGISRERGTARGGPDATASGCRRNKRSFLRAFDELVSSYRREIDAVDLLSLRDLDV